MVNSRVRFKIISKGNFNMEVHQHKENTSFTNNSKLVPLDFDASSSKRVIYWRDIKRTTGRITISVCKTVKENYTRPRYFVNSERVSDTIHRSPISGEVSKHNKDIRATICASGPGNIRVAGEGWYSESSNSSRQVSEQPLPCGKEG